MADKACFVISPIGIPDSETRKRSDLVLRYIIKPAVTECGYKATRADEMPDPGMITSQVIQRILNDPLVVADLSEHNANVFYELALRHATKKPLVQLIAKGERIPFDVAGMRTITVDHRDLESVEVTKQEIAAQVRAMEKAGEAIESPVSVSMDLQALRQSDKPQDRSWRMSSPPCPRCGLPFLRLRADSILSRRRSAFSSRHKDLRWPVWLQNTLDDESLANALKALGSEQLRRELQRRRIKDPHQHKKQVTQDSKTK